MDERTRLKNYYHQLAALDPQIIWRILQDHELPTGGVKLDLVLRAFCYTPEGLGLDWSQHQQYDEWDIWSSIRDGESFPVFMNWTQQSFEGLL